MRAKDKQAGEFLMRTLDALFAWLILGFGALHCAVAFGKYDRLSDDALWFFSGGLALLLLAALNLLRVRYAGVAPGVRRVCIAANLALLGFAVTYLAAHWERSAGSAGSWLLMAVLLGSTICSVSRRA